MICDPTSEENLLDCLRDRVPEVRMGAVQILGKLGDKRAIIPLHSLLSDPYSDIRDATQEAILKLTKKE